VITIALVAVSALVAADPVVWPNARSRANGDAWIRENHDRITEMRPRLLVLNFSNQTEPGKIDAMTRQLVAAIAESSRYHGYEDPKAPVFLSYEVFKTVDLRDPGKTTGNSSKSPLKKDAAPDAINMDYGALFGEEFARLYDVPDPKDPKRRLRLDEMIDAGFVHEVWFFAAATGDLRCLECIELKPVHDERCVPLPSGEVREAGNGEDPDRKWTGRSVRLNNLNPDRGIGCAMENLGHSLEGMAHSGVIPYFKKYFDEYAGFDLDARHGLPFDSFYPLWGKGKGVEYPDEKTAVVTDGEKTWRLEGYAARGGNVHFPPNARHHYDLENERPVLSTIEDWRVGSGPSGADVAKPFTNAAFARYRDVAPDCMGAWLVYWRQNMPGLGNRQKDDAGRPMKNWWPFLFY